MFTDWRTDDHLHLDMALDPVAGEWLDPGIRWVDPVVVLGTVLGEAEVRKIVGIMGRWEGKGYTVILSPTLHQQHRKSQVHQSKSSS
jgi:hypothetical protein